MAQLGIIGGGQLAAMLVTACRRHAQQAGAGEDSENPVYVLDPDPNCPAAQVGGVHVPGTPASGAGFRELAELADVLTIDLENVCVESLRELKQQGVRIVPDPDLLHRLTNKLHQKQWLQSLGLPTAEFAEFDGRQDISANPFGWPVVQKAARGGYDGRGVAVLRSPADNDLRLQVPGYFERFIERRMEVSVMVVATEDGDIQAYQPVEMVFLESGNVLDTLVAPARLPQQELDRARDLAVDTIRRMAAVGVFGIEMFLTTNNELLINEISPRTHNSGHYTSEACASSQFEQQRRILLGQELGSLEQHHPAVMFNLLGSAGYDGETVIEQQDEVGNDGEVFVHWYGKTRCFPGRKMGHVTVIGDTIESAIEKAEKIRRLIQVRGAKALA